MIKDASIYAHVYTVYNKQDYSQKIFLFLFIQISQKNVSLTRIESRKIEFP